MGGGRTRTTSVISNPPIPAGFIREIKPTITLPFSAILLTGSSTRIRAMSVVGVPEPGGERKNTQIRDKLELS